MSKQGPYIPFYPSDWLAGVGDMTPSETGVYINILMMIYDTGEPIKADFGRLARRMNCPKGTLTALVLGLAASKKLTVQSGFISNERAEKELKKREHKATCAAASARDRWSKNETKSNAGDMRTHSERNANQISEPDIDTNVSIARAKTAHKDIPKSGPFQDAIDAQSQTGRSRLKRPQAWASWQRLSKLHGEDKLLGAYKRYLSNDKDAQRDNGDWQAGLQVWLNQKAELWLEQQSKQPDKRSAAYLMRFFDFMHYDKTYTFPEDKVGMTEREARDIVVAAVADGSIKRPNYEIDDAA
jgi:uncharacterized protein YdaU (DUF1376 family)